MLNGTKFKLLSVQAALFLSDTKSFSQSVFLANVLGKFALRYDGAVQAIPLTNEAPAHFPRVILSSQDGQWKLQASLNRIDSFWVGYDTSQDNIDITDKCVEVLRNYVESTSVSISRLGLITTRFLESEAPAQELIDHFCNIASKTNPFRNSENFEIHNHKTYPLQKTKFRINSWVRCKTGRITSPSHKKAIVIEQDINTITEDSSLQKDFDLSNITMFYKEASQEMNNIFTIYFP